MKISDAISTVENEDVLSSIRRLVSEDFLAPGPQIMSKRILEDKLILTPNLRVVRSNAKPMPVPAASPLPRLHLGPAHMVIPAGATPNVVVTLGQAVGHQSLDWEAEIGDSGPDVDSLDWASFTFARRTLTEGRVTLTPATLVNTAAAELTPRPLTEAETASDCTDKAEANALADLHQDADEAPAEVMLDVAHDEDNIFSEQVLRELVRDLIRAELQGDLGERITRNIRKLVRAEIARAIAVQSLE